MCLVPGKVQDGAGDHDVGMLVGKRRLLDRLDAKVEGPTPAKRRRQAAHLRNRVGVDVVAADVVAVAKQIDEITAAAAPGVKHATARPAFARAGIRRELRRGLAVAACGRGGGRDATAQELIEDVDVDVAELLREGHRRKSSGAHTCWPIRQTSSKPSARYMAAPVVLECRMAMR